MTDQSRPTQLRLRAPSDVLAAVPYLLGFHPADSVVGLAFSSTRLVIHARTDLLPIGSPRAELAAVAEQLARLFKANGADAAICLGYGDPRQVTPLILATTKALRQGGLTVLDVLRVNGGRYWSYECTDPACCPPEGVPFDISTSSVAASATLAGCSALPSREELVKTLAAPDGPALHAARRATTRAEELAAGTPAQGGSKGPGQVGLAALAAAAGRYTAGGRLTDDEVASLAVSLQRDQGLRDAALIALVGGDAPDEHAMALWTDLVRRCAPQYVVAPAVLLAFTCWRRGDGVRASIAVDRALAVDEHCPAAQLLAELLATGVPPAALDPESSAGRHSAAPPARPSGRRGRAF